MSDPKTICKLSIQVSLLHVDFMCARFPQSVFCQGDEEDRKACPWWS